jgi:PIN domain nuclease of toxin-antitoxin system
MARIILDTQLLLWTIYKTRRVPPPIAALIEDQGNDVLFSAASVWEIAIKRALNRPDFNADPNDVVASAEATGYIELPVVAKVAAQVSTLPPIHKDPFDRLLIAQAIAEPARLLTSDRILDQYSELAQVFDPT